tara:strand:+ start:402 stop:1457 length:1056 start_codon:yes stop_codon:yes gene_type:complete
MNEKQKIEEIDLIKSFSYFGKIINRLFSISINIFISFANLIIQLFSIIKKKVIFFLISIILGAFIGAIYNGAGEVKYNASLTVTPQFGSVHQMYKNIEYYQTLIDERNYEELKSNLNLNLNEAKSINSISVSPFTSEFTIMKIYAKFNDLADSISGIKLNYKIFKEKLSFDDYPNHIISLTLDTVLVPSGLANSIVNSISENKYYESRQVIALKNLEEEKALINLSIGKLDSILFFQRTERSFEESVKKTLGTQIYMDDNQNQKIYSELFSNYSSFNDKLLLINTRVNGFKNIVNVISNFPKSAKKESSPLLPISSSILCFLISLTMIVVYDATKFINNNPNFKFKKVDYK